MSEELMPCPFCGSDDITLACTDYGYQEKCESCEARGPLARDRRQSAVVWKQRQAEAELAALREENARLKADQQGVARAAELMGRMIDDALETPAGKEGNNG